MSNESTDVAVIGAGPIGIELAVAMKKAGIDFLHFDARQIGHTIGWFAPQTRFFSSNDRIAIADVPLFTPDQTKATREQYLAYLRGVVRQFDLPIRTFEAVKEISTAKGTDGRFTLTTAKSRVAARRVVLATGGTERPRKLGVDGEDLPHVSHWLGDPHDYFQRNVFIVGGKNSAVEAALRCHIVGARVTICHRQPQIEQAGIKYWLWPEFSGLVQAGQIRAMMNRRISKIRPGHVVLKPVNGDGPAEEIPADVVLLLIGYTADMSLFRQAGVELLGTGEVPRFDPVTMRTNVPGLYVAGTAAAGTQQRYGLFIENCHIHVAKIVASLTGQPAPPEPPVPQRLET